MNVTSPSPAAATAPGIALAPDIDEIRDNEPPSIGSRPLPDPSHRPPPTGVARRGPLGALQAPLRALCCCRSTPTRP